MPHGIRETNLKIKTIKKAGVEDVKPKTNFSLTLSPLHRQTRVIMEISLNKESSATSFLHIKNPNNYISTVSVTKRPPRERFVDLSFTKINIEPNRAVILIITWSPQKVGVWWDFLHFTVNNRSQFEVTLAMTAKNPRRHPLVEENGRFQNKNAMIGRQRKLDESNEENEEFKPNVTSTVKKPRRQTSQLCVISRTFTISSEYSNMAETELSNCVTSVRTSRRRTYVIVPTCRKMMTIYENESADCNYNFNFIPLVEEVDKPGLVPSFSPPTRDATLEKSKIDEKIKACLRIQTWWRSILLMRKCRRNYLEMKDSMTKLQRRDESKFDEAEIENEREIVMATTLKLQVCFLSVLIKKKIEFLTHRAKVIMVMENWWKNALNERKIEEESVGEIEGESDGEIEEETIREIEEETIREIEEEEVREIEEEKVREIEIRKKEDAAIKIQAAYRGYMTRKLISLRMEELKSKAKKAAKTVKPGIISTEELREAIILLDVSDDLGRLTICFASLDLITRLSSKSCIVVCEAGLVDKIFKILSRSNRSLPWMEVCLRGTSTLLNLAKYSPTKSFVLKEAYIEILAKWIKISVEKNDQLFLHVTTLMWVLAEDSNYALAILKDHRATWLLSSVHNLVTRKESKSRRDSRKIKPQLKLPSLKPDWGLKQKQPRLFASVLHAVNSLQKRLSDCQI